MSSIWTELFDSVHFGGCIIHQISSSVSWVEVKENSQEFSGISLTLPWRDTKPHRAWVLGLGCLVKPSSPVMLEYFLMNGSSILMERSSFLGFPWDGVLSV